MIVARLNTRGWEEETPTSFSAGSKSNCAVSQTVLSCSVLLTTTNVACGEGKKEIESMFICLLGKPHKKQGGGGAISFYPRVMVKQVLKFV